MGAPYAVLFGITLILAFYAWIRALALLAAAFAWVATAGAVGIERTPTSVRKLAVGLSGAALLVVSGVATSQVFTFFAPMIGLEQDYDSFEEFLHDLFGVDNATHITRYALVVL